MLFKIFAKVEIELLIVPYGIETMSDEGKFVCTDSLLIVPYGIETQFRDPVYHGKVAFNCTLWN